MPLKFDIIVDDKGSVAINRLGKKITKLGNKTKSFGSTFKAVFGAQLLLKGLGLATNAVRKFVASFAAVAKAGDDFDKMSKRVGASVEFLSQFGHVAELAGTSVASIEPAFKRLARNMNDAQQGLAESADAFKAVGIEVSTTGGRLRSVDSVIIETAAKFKLMKDETKKLALAQELFGRGGAAMVPILNQGTVAIRAQMAEARRLGIAWTTEGAAKAAEYTDAMTRLNSTWAGLKRATILPIIAKLTPKIEALTKKVLASKEKFQGFANTVMEWVDNFWIGIQGLRFLFAATMVAFNRVFVVGILQGLNMITQGLATMLTNMQGLLLRMSTMWGPIGASAKLMLKPITAMSEGMQDLSVVINDKLLVAWGSNDLLMENARVKFEALKKSAIGAGAAIKDAINPKPKGDGGGEDSPLSFLEKMLIQFKVKAESIAQTIGQSIGSGIVKGFQDFDFDDFGKSFMKLGLQIAGMVLPTAIGGPFGALFGGVFSGIAGGLQTGTDSARGGVYTVGEKGPETVVLPKGSQVMPHDRMSSRMDDSANTSRGGGGVTVNIQGNLIGQESFVRDQLIPALAMEMRR